MSATEVKFPNYAATYDYTTDDGWSMSKTERRRIYEQAEEYDDNGDVEGFEREIKKLPLAPNMAWMLRDLLGKQKFLAEGYNLKDAEIAYGKNWLDDFNVINNNEGRK